MTATLRFAKMSGAGNDFIVLGVEEADRLGGRVSEWTRSVCRRGISIGADGVLVVTPAGSDRVRLRFFNPDGGEAFCGNGTRCAARFAYLRGLAGRSLVVETCAGDVPAEVRAASVRLVVPTPQDRGRRSPAGPGGTVEGRFVLAGSPHFVVSVEDVEAWPLPERGPWIRRHPDFGREGVNVDIVGESGGGSLRIRTWERGVEAETLSCGSGALAAAWVVWNEGRRGRVRIVPASGLPLFVNLPDGTGPSLHFGFEGDARLIFEGILGPDAREAARVQ